MMAPHLLKGFDEPVAVRGPAVTVHAASPEASERHLHSARPPQMTAGSSFP